MIIMPILNKITKSVKNKLILGSFTIASLLNSYTLAQSTKYEQPKTQAKQTTEKKQEEKYFVIAPGRNQDQNSSNDLATRVDSEYNVVKVNMPDGGHRGWKQNKIAIHNSIKDIKGEGNVFYCYSAGCPSLMSYLEEHPEFISNNPNATFIMLDPAVKSSFGEVMTSLPVRIPYMIHEKRLSPSQLDLELSGRDKQGFLENMHQGLDTLAENWAKSDWDINIIKLNSPVVNGSTIDEVAQKIKDHDVSVKMYTPDEIMNKFSLPTIGNKGIFPAGKDIPWATTKEYFREKAVHAWWAPRFRSTLNEFISDLTGPSHTNRTKEKSELNQLPIPSDVKNKKYVPHPDSKDAVKADHGGIDFGSVVFNYVTQDKIGDVHYFGYSFKATQSDKGNVSVESSCPLSLESFLNFVILPDDIFWVNLNPAEPNRIIEERLGKTDAGLIMLQKDLQLKKEFAKFSHPNTILGEKYWNELAKMVGNVSISNRLWIVPGKIDLYATPTEIYIVDAKLDVKLESEYLNSIGQKSGNRNLQSEQITKNLILPEIIRAVNNDDSFAELRQVYYARIMAECYEKHLLSSSQVVLPSSFSSMVSHSYRERPAPMAVYLLESGKMVFAPPKGEKIVKILNLNELEEKENNKLLIEGARKWNPKEIFDEYVRSYQQGEYNFTKTTASGQYILKTHYFMGGVDFARIEPEKFNYIDKEIPNEIKRKVFDSIFDPLGSQQGNDYQFGGILIRK